MFMVVFVSFIVVKKNRLHSRHRRIVIAGSIYLCVFYIPRWMNNKKKRAAFLFTIYVKSIVSIPFVGWHFSSFAFERRRRREKKNRLNGIDLVFFALMCMKGVWFLAKMLFYNAFDTRSWIKGSVLYEYHSVYAFSYRCTSLMQ